jgi:hypothetical protein
VDITLVLLATGASVAFTFDLIRSYQQHPRPHAGAYAAGMAMFALATMALAQGLIFGWGGANYRVFFLFGAILNIPFLALGSMFLVGGRRAGTIMFLLLGALSAISITLTTTVPFAQPLPAGGVPQDIFPEISAGFGPRLLAAIGGGLGASILILLSVVSVIRFWRKNRRIVWGNLLVLGGTLAASTGGAGLAVGRSSAFSLSLLAAVTLIWLGFRVASGARSPGDPRIAIGTPGPPPPG